MRYALEDIGTIEQVAGVVGLRLRDAVRRRWRLPAWVPHEVAELVRQAERARWEARLTRPELTDRPLWLRDGRAGAYIVNDACALEAYTLTTGDVEQLTGWSKRWILTYARCGHLPAFVTPRAQRWCPIVVAQARSSAAFWWPGAGDFRHTRRLPGGEVVELAALYDAHKRGETGRPIRGGREWG